jgi:chromate transporter
VKAVGKTKTTSPEPGCEAVPIDTVPFSEAFWVWSKVALNSFGGPAGQIAVMHRYVVEEKKWISESRFLHALNYCMLLPGPEAQQLATYIGWLLHRTLGGIVAGTLFVIPGFLAILVLSILYAGYQNLSAVQWLFFGLKPAVLAVVVEAVLRIGKRTLKNRVMLTLAGLAFVGIFFFAVPFPVIVFAAAVLGYVGGRLRTDAFSGNTPHSADGTDCGGPVVDAMMRRGTADHTRPSLARALRVGLVWCALWLGPTVLLFHYLGPGNVFFQQAVFFSKAAAVTFGGAYSVLAYVAQQAVDTYAWLKPGEMLDGLGLAETTPGPLVMVLEFVGFLASYRNPGGLHPMVAGMLGAVLTTWVTFVPCFLWIFLGAPYIEALRGKTYLNSALSAVTAAVVGVVLNLAVWFSLHTVFEKIEDVYVLGMHLLVPVWQTLNIPSLAIALFALTAIFRFKISTVKTIGCSAVLGIAYHAVCWALL